MKKTLLLYTFLTLLSITLLAQPVVCDYTPTPLSYSLTALVEIEGIAASSGDWIAAFDEDGNCAGATQLINYYGQAFSNLQVYADDLTTPDIDEGINEGETFTVKLWVAATSEILDHPMDLPPLCVGPFCNPPTQNGIILNFSRPVAMCTQTINLNAGWNLISLDVSPVENRITDMFYDFIMANNLQFIVGFDQGAKTFDPYLPPDILNTLSTMKDGFGYLVKVENTDVLTVEGTCLDDDFRIPLNAGWNLIAYPPDESQSPATYFADLIADGNLIFVQSFYNGIVTFDPNRPPFLNTLKQMKNGYGYWVKVNNATD